MIYQVYENLANIQDTLIFIDNLAAISVFHEKF